MQQNLIIGVSGHIDHGKTSLIAALNGFWGDESRQEKERGITLDLSFSNLRLGGRNLAFIDVPGHERLVKNMIAGAFGLDFMMLVIAANEGIKPQSVEHLRIAMLLGIKEFLVVLSKSDLVDLETLKTREEEIRKFLSGFKEIKFEILSFSIYDKNSIESLKNKLISLQKKDRVDLGFYRYYIDRAFSIKGSGCVVSGTLMDGDLSKDDKLWLAQSGRMLSIKGLQNHKESVELAHNGERVAINLAGISHNELKRGDLLTKKGYLRGFDCIEVELELFTEILHNSVVQLYIGSMRCACRVLFLDSSKKFATLKAKIPLFCIFNERFILRNDSQTLGGGRVLSPIADPMKKAQKLEYLELLSKGDLKGAFEILLKAHKKGFGLISAIQRFRIPQRKALEIAFELVCEGAFVCKKELVVYPLKAREIVKNQIKNILRKNPNALLSAALLAQKQSFIAESFAQDILEELLAQKLLKKAESFYISLNSELDSQKGGVQEYLYTTIYNTLHTQGYAPEAPYNLYDELDIDRASGDAIFKRLTREKKIVRLNHRLFICADVLGNLLEFMRKIIKEEGYLELSNFKNHLSLSRKYYISYLDYLDSFSDIVNTQGRRTFKK
ncbi:MAG: selenocysteine-specific translation elongation factor [Helicobacteraceae bacterium]|nr:selenocysteine-specific translation elongation factor [Helicobacteraceae bacterium]